jgi:hypothetical protein
MKEKKEISIAIKKLFSRLQVLNLQNLEISDYNRIYLQKYINNYYYYMTSYSQLLQKAIDKLKKPVIESTFIDYGGGCGLLSLLAKETGFRTVVYNDIDKSTLHGAQIISKNLDIIIDDFICGDVGELIAEINHRKVIPDVICSFDVLEHIYDLELWIKTIAGINYEFSLLFMTSANSCNPFISNRLKKLHFKSEYLGFEKNIRNNNAFLSTSSFEERKNIIRNQFSELKPEDIEFVAKKTRGLNKSNIENITGEYIKTGEITYKIRHPTNTCDPYTGSWTERLIDLRELKILINSYNLDVTISNSLYGYNNNKTVNALKYLLNILIRLTGPKNLLLSPTYTLEISRTVRVNKSN